MMANQEPASTRQPAELIELKVKQVLEDSNTDTRIVVLKSDDGSETLPIWVGAAEGNAIRLAMEQVVTPRPMSHDLIRSSPKAWIGTWTRDRATPSPWHCGRIALSMSRATY
jgi:hypothetical protein